MLVSLLSVTVLFVAGELLGAEDAVSSVHQCRRLCGSFTSPEILREHNCDCANEQNFASYELQLRKKSIRRINKDEDILDSDEIYPVHGLSFLDYPFYVSNSKPLQIDDEVESTDRRGRLRDNGRPKLHYRARKPNKTYARQPTITHRRRVKYNETIDDIYANLGLDADDLQDTIDPTFIKDLQDVNMNVTDFIKCIDLHILLYLKNVSDTDTLEDILKIQRFKSYKSISDDELLREIKNRCANAEKTIEALIEDIKMSFPSKNCDENTCTSTTDILTDTTTTENSHNKYVGNTTSNKIVRATSESENLLADFDEHSDKNKIVQYQNHSLTNFNPKINSISTTHYEDNITHFPTDKITTTAGYIHTTSQNNGHTIRAISTDVPQIAYANSITSTTELSVKSTVFHSIEFMPQNYSDIKTTDVTYTKANQSTAFEHDFTNNDLPSTSPSIVTGDVIIENETTIEKSNNNSSIFTTNKLSNEKLGSVNYASTTIDGYTRYTIAEINVETNEELNKEIAENKSTVNLNEKTDNNSSIFITSEVANNTGSLSTTTDGYTRYINAEINVVTNEELNKETAESKTTIDLKEKTDNNSLIFTTMKIYIDNRSVNNAPTTTDVYTRYSNTINVGTNEEINKVIVENETIIGLKDKTDNRSQIFTTTEVANDKCNVTNTYTSTKTSADGNTRYTNTQTNKGTDENFNEEIVKDEATLGFKETTDKNSLFFVTTEVVNDKGVVNNTYTNIKTATGGYTRYTNTEMYVGSNEEFNKDINTKTTYLESDLNLTTKVTEQIKRITEVHKQLITQSYAEINVKTNTGTNAEITDGTTQPQSNNMLPLSSSSQPNTLVNTEFYKLRKSTIDADPKLIETTKLIDINAPVENFDVYTTASNNNTVHNNTDTDLEEQESEKIISILTREFPNNTVISSTDNAAVFQNPNNNSADQLPEPLVGQSLINGSLYFLWNDYLLPSRFVQMPDGKIHVGVNAMTLCDEMNIENNTSLIKLICRHVTARNNR